MEEIRKIVREIIKESMGNTYYHGSCKDFDRFDNIGYNKSITIFGDTLEVQGNFITKNKDFASVFAKQGEECFIYKVDLLTNNIFDLRDEDNLALYKKYLEDNFEKTGFSYEDLVEEGYFTNGLPTWDNYPAIELAKLNGFDGIKLQEFSADVSHDPIESIMVFNPSLIKIVGKSKA